MFVLKTYVNLHHFNLDQALNGITNFFYFDPRRSQELISAEEHINTKIMLDRNCFETKYFRTMDL